MSKILFRSVVLLVVFFTFSTASANISGAIFTTESSCNGTNVNKFDLKTDVYLDGGPHRIGSAGLPNGDYDVQVTAPNGELLGSTFGTAPVHVGNFIPGKFDTCYQLWAILLKASNGSQGYDDTPNHGGVYKVWITKNYTPGEGVNGFIHAWSKTDNFKVGPGTSECPTPSVIKVHKFDDSNADGVKDNNEVEIEWSIDATDPCGSVITKTAPFDDLLASPAGTWQICEQIRDNWQQTYLIIDGVKIEPPINCAPVVVGSDCGEVHEVIFGNIKLASITACKFYDRDGNGVNNNEPPVAGIKFILDGNDVLGNHVHQDANSGPGGCVFFNKLLPGNYTLCEVLPQSWVATTDICQNVILTEGNDVSLEFGNVCTGTAAFGTKGYWHNKNGLAETVPADFNCLNSLLPWQKPSTYFGAGDEPIDGYFNFSDGTPNYSKPIPAAKDASGKVIAVAGTAKAEQSYFLIDENRGGDPREQLAQQLDAFIMNMRHRLDGPDTVIQKPDGHWVSASYLITESVAIWQSGSASQKTARSSLLDTLNNSSTVVFIHHDPCPIIYLYQ